MKTHSPSYTGFIFTLLIALFTSVMITEVSYPWLMKWLQIQPASQGVLLLGSTLYILGKLVYVIPGIWAYKHPPTNMPRILVLLLIISLDVSGAILYMILTGVQKVDMMFMRTSSPIRTTPSATDNRPV